MNVREALAGARAAGCVVRRVRGGYVVTGRRGAVVVVTGGVWPSAVGDRAVTHVVEAAGFGSLVALAGAVA